MPDGANSLAFARRERSPWALRSSRPSSSPLPRRRGSARPDCDLSGEAPQSHGPSRVRYAVATQPNGAVVPRPSRLTAAAPSSSLSKPAAATAAVARSGFAEAFVRPRPPLPWRRAKAKAGCGPAPLAAAGGSSSGSSLSGCGLGGSGSALRLRCPHPAVLRSARLSAAESGSPTPGSDMRALRVWWVLLGTLGVGSAQLLFQNFTSVVVDHCNSSVILPCIITNLLKNRTRDMFVKWKLGGSYFFAFSGYEQPPLTVKNSTFQSAELACLPKLTMGIASLSLSKEEAIPGNYSCEVTESNREGVTTFELKHVKGPWFKPVDNVLIIITMVLATIFYWAQLGVVATKYDISFLKKISLIIAGLIVTVAAVIGCILLIQDGFATSNQTGLGLIVLPAVILVPLLYILLDSVFEKPPCFAVMLLVLKALGYVIAVIGFAMSVSACPPQQAPVMVAGLAIIDLVAVIALVYVIIIGSNFKDHQPPRKAVEEPLNAPDAS
ncbi:leukocyte surface antigen CD47 isoform X2 [Eublepharis macularius]|uniref:Leukocyte surface antigen CD47 n=1 Tax=Eublepharis macularius TaxID=481883 RepID=A0AA97J3H1_EUBMA|nr:leukocyte surface antigen CD47 isoform X2 [Eublepharis macularius]